MSSTDSKNALGDSEKRYCARAVALRGSRRPSTQRIVESCPIEHTITYGSVFDAICDSPNEVRNLTFRSELMIRIKRLSTDRGVTQAETTKLFGVTQPRISGAVRGKINQFSIDMLSEMLLRAGMEVDITVKPKAA